MRHAAALLALSSLSLGCDREVARGDRIVLEIAGEGIALGEFDQSVESSAHHDTPVLPADVTAALFEQFIEERLLLRAAADAGIEVDEAEVARRRSALAERISGASNQAAITRSIEHQLLIGELWKKEVLGRIDVRDDEIRERYEENQDFYTRPETVTVSEILVHDRAHAESLQRELSRTPDRFEEAAREHSVGPEAQRGGRLGSFGRGELPRSIEVVVFGVSPGGISEVVTTDFGHHVFRVHERQEETLLEFDDVRDLVRAELLREKSDSAMAAFLEELQRRYPVVVHREHLSFAFPGWGSEDERASTEEGTGS